MPFQRSVVAFAQSESGIDYELERNKVRVAFNRLTIAIRTVRDDPSQLAAAVAEAREEIISGILAIPTEDEGTVLEARSPFQAYMRLKSFFETITRTLVWADPYMGPGLFHRYLNELPPSANVCLVTAQRNNSEFQSFLDISRLFAQERGAAKYRLVVEPTNHDRWLRCDDQLYHLGGSAKDAGQRSPFTISKLEPTPGNFKKLDDLIASGTELFGPCQQVHQ